MYVLYSGLTSTARTELGVFHFVWINEHVALVVFCVLRLNRISTKVNISRKTVFISMLISYWKLKRQSRNGVPLIRRLQASRQGQRVSMYKVREGLHWESPLMILCDDVM